jgi:hypothetical protein
VSAFARPCVHVSHYVVLPNGWLQILTLVDYKFNGLDWCTVVYTTGRENVEYIKPLEYKASRFVVTLKLERENTREVVRFTFWKWTRTKGRYSFFQFFRCEYYLQFAFCIMLLANFVGSFLNFALDNFLNLAIVHLVKIMQPIFRTQHFRVG